MTLREFELFTLAAAIAAMWAQIRAWLSWPVSLLIVRRRIDTFSSGCVLSYLQTTARWRPRGGYYSSEKTFVRPLGRAYRVWYEALKEAPQTFWLRRRPVWYAPVESTSPSPGSPREVTSGQFAYLRGTVDWPAILEAAAAWEDAILQEIQDGQRNRFHVVYHGRSNARTDSAEPSAAPTASIGLSPSYGQRLLRWSAGDLAVRTPLALDHLSLRPELVAATDRVRQWAESKEWCEERGIPWRLGLLLHGAPGTGKTSLARGLAVEHNLPVHVFDLAALDNFALHSHWDGMLRDAPCMVLIEDIDAVYGRIVDGKFDPRALVTEGPTFDAVLNCIAGVQAADGVLLVVTSNRPDTIDPALKRRGRLDVHVAVTGLDAAGRRKMIDRILRDLPVDPAMADDPAIVEMTPADLQEHLIQLALTQRFGEAA